MKTMNLDFYFVYDPAFWLVAIVVFILACLLGRFWQGREGRLKILIEQANLKTKQILELEKVNKEFETKNRELYAKELELTMANKRLQSLEEAKSKFVSVTTHQLRTPLAAVKWTFDMAVKGQLGPVNEEQKKFLNQGLTSANRVISIVNDLLKVDSIDSERSDFEFKPSDITALIDNVIFEFANHAKSKDIKLIFSKPANELPFIDMDSNKIRMVLENLIDNAIKYNPTGGQVLIKLSDSLINSAEGSLEISITDSGIGIPKGEEEKIFQKFFRAGNAIKQEPDGSGLGLYIARDIIEKHGGAIWFENKTSGGTAFTFTLPLHQKKV